MRWKNHMRKSAQVTTEKNDLKKRTKKHKWRTAGSCSPQIFHLTLSTQFRTKNGGHSLYTANKSMFTFCILAYIYVKIIHNLCLRPLIEFLLQPNDKLLLIVLTKSGGHHLKTSA